MQYQTEMANKMTTPEILAFADKILGSEDVRRQGAIKRMEIRDIMGSKLMREVTLK